MVLKLVTKWITEIWALIKCLFQFSSVLQIANRGKETAIKSKSAEKKKIDLPADFMKEIKNLGLKEADAKVLFDSKINWTAVYADDKIYCTEKGCDFVSMIHGDEMRNHGKLVHNYGEYPCRDEYCSYVGYSQVRYLISYDSYHMTHTLI